MENAQNNNIVKFEVGKSYYYRFACSYDTVVTVTVIKRTSKTITIDDNGEDSVYSGRYDIGDGEGGLLNHIRNFGEWHRTHEEFGKEKAIPDETNEILEFVKMLEKAA